RALSDDAKLVFLMLLTHPGMTALGAMRGTPQGLAAELGWLPEAYAKAFAEVCGKGMAKHDGAACFIWLPKFLAYNLPESPNVIKAWRGSLDLLPECEMKSVVIPRARDIALGMSKGFHKAFAEVFPEALAHPSLNQEQEQEQEQEPKRLLSQRGTNVSIEL